MRIGYMLPANFALGTRTSGIAEQARRQAEALELLGHTVVRLDPWHWQDERELDVLHFFLGGPAMVGLVESRASESRGIRVFSPIIDSNQSFGTYRVAAALGELSGRFMTVPGILRRQARASDVVVCRSTHEMQRVSRGLGISSQKIAIVLNGCPLPASSAGDPHHTRDALDLPQDFVLHISTFTQERKNILRLLAATQRLGFPLVIAGVSQPGPILAELERRARGNERLRILGFVDEQTKAALYALCRVFCLPSLHEGTGLAALEAGAQGASLVITRNGGPPDYFLDHARYVDPLSVQSIQEGISQAWLAPKDDRLRRHIIERLSWNESGKALERLYSSRLAAQSRRAGVLPQGAEKLTGP